MKLDGSLEDVEYTRFDSLFHDHIRTFSKTSKFTESELTSLFLIYYKFILIQEDHDGQKYITQEQLYQFLDAVFCINDTLTVDRIVQTVAKTYRNFVTPKEWIYILEIFFKGTLEEQIKYCFAIYDVEGSNELTRDALLKFLKVPFVEDEEDGEILKEEFLEILTRKMDQDRDGKISFEDYAKTVRKSPCMLEFLGKCLPDIDTLIVKAFHVCNISTKLQELGLYN